jgi:putative SOS response-associated peptidase YedK
MSKIHNSKQRMPIILHKEDENHWLEGKDYSKFAFPYDVSLYEKKVN